MQSENKIIIVIPVYKEELTDSEIVSLCRVIKVLPQCVFSIVCPHTLTVSNYLKYFNTGVVRVSITRFHDDYFESVEGYNRLMLSSQFYLKFQSWEYILIYQLDCFIFKNEINKWIGQDFDYIGSPWIDNERTLNFYNSLNYSKWSILRILKKTIDFNKGEKTHVGNGGFSLRKVKTFIRISKILNLLFKRHLRGHVNEDFIWSLLVTKYFSSFKVPPVSMASRFAIEQTPEPIDIEDAPSLPMASHAWKRYYPEVWKELILKFN